MSYQQEKFTEIANAIRDKLGTTKLIKPSDFASKVDEVYDTGYEKGKAAGGNTTEAYNQGVADGKQAEYDRFWDEAQQNGGRAFYRQAFCGGTWTSENLKPKYPYEFPEGTTTACQDMFSFCGQANKETDGMVDLSFACAKFDFSKCKEATRTFADCYVKNITVNFSSAEKLTNTFYTGNGGKTDNIKLKVSAKCTYNNTFAYNTLLKSLEFLEGSEIGNSISFASSSALTAESVQNIIDHLVDLTGKTAQTITFHKKVVITDTQKAKISSLNWSLSQI